VADTVLVTGGSGFIGSHLCRMLVERGDRVINFDLCPRRGALAWLMRSLEPEILFEKGDVANWTQVMAMLCKYEPNKIAHLAASIDIDTIESYPKQVFDQMVGGTVNILESMRLWGALSGW
jgi:nucleoside-diphosphate-sugar epimerase